MLQEMAKREQIAVTETARTELKKLLADAEGQRPRIYIDGFG